MGGGLETKCFHVSVRSPHRRVWVFVQNLYSKQHFYGVLERNYTKKDIIAENGSYRIISVMFKLHLAWCDDFTVICFLEPLVSHQKPSPCFPDMAVFVFFSVFSLALPMTPWANEKPLFIFRLHVFFLLLMPLLLALIQTSVTYAQLRHHQLCPSGWGPTLALTTELLCMDVSQTCLVIFILTCCCSVRLTLGAGRVMLVRPLLHKPIHRDKHRKQTDSSWVVLRAFNSLRFVTVLYF